MPEQQAASSALRVIIVSDVRVVQEGLTALLGRHDGVDVVGTVDTPRALDQSVRMRPNVVLVDAARGDSVGFVKDLVAAAPQCRVVAFGVRESAEEQILALAAAGTAGYVRASANGNDLVGVLERVMRDELPCSPRTAASLYRQVAALARKGAGAISLGGCEERGVPLSRRELQIARLIDCGLANKDIARRLGIETATVKNHLHNMYEKLKVHRRGEAAARIRTLLGVRAPFAARASAADAALLARPELSPARGES